MLELHRNSQVIASIVFPQTSKRGIISVLDKHVNLNSLEGS